MPLFNAAALALDLLPAPAIQSRVAGLFALALLLSLRARAAPSTAWPWRLSSPRWGEHCHAALPLSSLAAPTLAGPGPFGGRPFFWSEDRYASRQALRPPPDPEAQLPRENIKNARPTGRRAGAGMKIRPLQAGRALLGRPASLSGFYRPPIGPKRQKRQALRFRSVNPYPEPDFETIC